MTNNEWETDETAFRDALANPDSYLDVRQHPNEGSKLVSDCIRHFNSKKSNILLSNPQRRLLSAIRYYQGLGVIFTDYDDNCPNSYYIRNSQDFRTLLHWPLPRKGHLNKPGPKLTKDPRCRFIFLEKISPMEDIIKVTEEMLLQILCYHQVSPCYLNLISSFRSESLTAASDVFFGGFRKSMSFNSPKHRIGRLGRSGSLLQLCFKLKAVFEPESRSRSWHGSESGTSDESCPAPLTEPDWSIHEAAIYLSFDVIEGRAVWIITAPRGEPDRTKRTEDDSNSWDNIMNVSEVWPTDGSARDAPSSLSSCLSVLEWFSEWSLSDYGFYVALLDERLCEMSQPLLSDKHAPPITENMLQIFDNYMERLNNCIVMLENNVRIFEAITEFFTKELRNITPMHEPGVAWLSKADYVARFDAHMHDVRRVTQEIGGRAKLLRELVRRREKLAQRVLQNRLRELSQADSTAMRGFSFITLILLPVTVVSTVFATDIVHFQEPTPIIINAIAGQDGGSSADTSDTALSDNSLIKTYHGKFSKWALMWWFVWCIILTLFVLGGSFCYQSYERRLERRKRKERAFWSPPRVLPASPPKPPTPAPEKLSRASTTSFDYCCGLAPRRRQRDQQDSGDNTMQDSPSLEQSDMTFGRYDVRGPHKVIAALRKHFPYLFGTAGRQTGELSGESAGNKFEGLPAGTTWTRSALEEKAVQESTLEIKPTDFGQLRHHVSGRCSEARAIEGASGLSGARLVESGFDQASKMEAGGRPPSALV